MLLVDHNIYVPTYVSSDASTFVSAAPAGYRTEKGTDPGSTTGPARFVYAPVGTGFRTDSTSKKFLPGWIWIPTNQVYPWLMGRPPLWSGEPAHWLTLYQSPHALSMEWLANLGLWRLYPWLFNPSIRKVMSIHSRGSPPPSKRNLFLLAYHRRLKSGKVRDRFPFMLPHVENESNLFYRGACRYSKKMVSVYAPIAKKWFIGRAMRNTLCTFVSSSKPLLPSKLS